MERPEVRPGEPGHGFAGVHGRRRSRSEASPQQRELQKEEFRGQDGGLFPECVTEIALIFRVLRIRFAYSMFLPRHRSESLTLPAEYGTNATVILPRLWLFSPRRPRYVGQQILPGEDGMDFEKDNFDDETELSPLEDEELGGESDGLVETEEEELIITEEPEEEAAPKPAAKPAAKKSAPKAKKAAAKKAKKASPKKKTAKKGKKTKKAKAGKKRKR